MKYTKMASAIGRRSCWRIRLPLLWTYNLIFLYVISTLVHDTTAQVSREHSMCGDFYSFFYIGCHLLRPIYIYNVETESTCIIIVVVIVVVLTSLNAILPPQQTKRTGDCTFSAFHRNVSQCFSRLSTSFHLFLQATSSEPLFTHPTACAYDFWM